MLSLALDALGRDRSPCEQCCEAGEATGPWQSRPVPERVCAGRDRSRAGETGSRTLVFRVRSERPVPTGERPVPLGENCPDRAVANLKRKEKKEKRRRRSLLGALEHHLLPHLSPLEAWSLLLELCGGSNFNPTWF
uniref:Uncharacterized protein n=1 Tax=Ananas comosus var. bracteatus TaxID=296719 RepID=A0A6V7QM59_ANACO|nr:unnamed protein product [Ananas comosus var. bracteatus]